jgi:hypothetical protein
MLPMPAPAPNALPVRQTVESNQRRLVEAIEFRHDRAKGTKERVGDGEARRRRKSALGKRCERARLAAQPRIRSVEIGQKWHAQQSTRP